MLLAGTAGAARADTPDGIIFTSVSSPNDNLGSLALGVNSSSPISSLSVHVVNQATQADVLDPALSQTSSTYDQGARTYVNVWTVVTPVTTADLTPGDYTILVDVADQGGTTLTGASAGTWEYTSVPVISVSSDRLSFDYDHPAATVTGSVSMHNPDGTITPYQGQLQLWQSWADIGTVQSDAGGNFSVTVRPTSANGSNDVNAFIWQSSANRYGGSNPVGFTVTKDPAKISAVVSPSLVQYGAQASITGTVTYQPAGQAGYVPATNIPVNLRLFLVYPYTGVPAATGTTDASGNFSIPLPQNTGADWTLEADTGPGSSLLSLPQVSLRENVVFNTAVTGFAAALNQHWGLSFSGCLGLTASIPGAAGPPVSHLRLQWAPTRTGPWRTISSSIRLTGGQCRYGSRFSGTASAPQNYAFYRATFLAAAAVPTYDQAYHASSSNVVLAWKYADRIAGLSVGPTTVNRNGRITVKGTLQYYYSGWHNYAGQTIMIVLKPKGDTQWYWIVKVRTNSRGQFSATFADPVTAYWAAYYDGNGSHLSVQSGSVHVTVR